MDLSFFASKMLPGSIGTTAPVYSICYRRYCWLVPLFFIIYGLYGPFYSVVEPVGVTNSQEFFDLLSKEERPIKWVLFGGFVGQFFLLFWVLITAKEEHGFLLLSFSLLGIYASLFAVLFAADSLFLSGLG